MSRTLIHGGRLVDPAQGIDRPLELVLEGGRVRELLEPGSEAAAHLQKTADCVIDATGLIVAPGFVDIHMHEDPLDEAQGRPVQNISLTMLKMGVTTAVGGNCGNNYGPPAAWLDAADREGVAVNQALLAGHTWLRAACGQEDIRGSVDDDTVAAMTRLGEEALEAGCVGISFGVKYVPGTRREEITALSRLAARRGRLVTSHVRNDVDGVFDACRELSEMAFGSGAAVQFSHIGSMGGYGQMERLLDQIERYRSMGVDMMADCYPYDAFSTTLGATTYDAENFAAYRAGYDRILLCDGEFAGQRCTEALFHKLRAEAPGTLTVGYFMNQEEVDLALEAPFVMLGSDGLLNGSQGHPRAAGAFPRFLRRYAASGRLPLKEALAKITSMPAERLGLKRKGSLAVGCDADVTIFDLATVADRADYEHPVLPPEGIRRVLIAGETALADGEVRSARLGRAVRS